MTIVLPSEYGIDPTGIGGKLGLAEMGQIKVQLAEEAALDAAKGQMKAAPATVPGQGSSLVGRIFANLVIGTASAQAAPAIRTDEMKVTLKPGEATEIKLAMKEGAKVDYEWMVSGGVVNFDLHGDGDGQSTSYEKGRASPGGKGILTAAFPGNHGWFWRNRGSADVVLTLRTSGDYTDIKRMD
ncbi:MAG TPA: transmembrane anchor protein [Ancylobacter sp.]